MAAKQDTISASAAYTTAGNSPAVTISTGTQMAVCVNITAGSGTITAFNLWMEGSVDSGATWFRILADQIDDNGSDQATPRANIVNNKNTTTAGVWGANYDTLPAMMIRCRWTLTGTTPSLTFQVNYGVK